MSRISGDLFRLLSIVFVLIIHATWPWEEAFRQRHEFWSIDFLGAVLNQLARFSVPAFVFLSGYGLSLKYLREARAAPSSELLPGGTLRFFRERALRIGLPFLAWTLIFFFLSGRFTLPADLSGGRLVGAALWDNLSALFPLLYRKGADYHFYFFHIIIECYLVFPLLFALLQRCTAKWRVILWLAFFLVHVFFNGGGHMLARAFGFAWPQFFSAFLVYWVFYFVSGILFAFAAPQTRAQLEDRRWINVILTLFAFALVMEEYIRRSYTAAAPDHYNHFSRLTVMLFTLMVIRLFASWDSRLQPQLLSRPWLSRTASLGAELSFFVFLFHTWILRGLRFAWPEIPLLLLIPALVVLSFALAHLLHLALPEWRLIRAALGLPTSAVRRVQPTPRS